MKLIVAVVQGKDADRLVQALTARGFRATRIDSTGGFLRESNVTLLIGVQEAYAPEVMRIVRENSYTRTRFVNPLMPIVEPGEFFVSQAIEAHEGGAVCFVLTIERYERIG